MQGRRGSVSLPRPASDPSEATHQPTRIGRGRCTRSHLHHRCAFQQRLPKVSQDADRTHGHAGKGEPSTWYVPEGKKHPLPFAWDTAVGLRERPREKAIQNPFERQGGGRPERDRSCHSDPGFVWARDVEQAKSTGLGTEVSGGGRLWVVRRSNVPAAWFSLALPFLSNSLEHGPCEGRWRKQAVHVASVRWTLTNDDFYTGCEIDACTYAGREIMAKFRRVQKKD